MVSGHRKREILASKNIFKTPDVWTGDAINKDPLYLERQSVGSSSQMCSGWQTEVLLFIKYLFYCFLKKIISNKSFTGILNKRPLFCPFMLVNMILSCDTHDLFWHLKIMNLELKNMWKIFLETSHLAITQPSHQHLKNVSKNISSTHTGSLGDCSGKDVTHCYTAISTSWRKQNSGVQQPCGRIGRGGQKQKP